MRFLLRRHLLLLLGSLVLYTHGLEALGVWIDEGIEIQFSLSDWGALLERLKTSELHPPLHYCLLHLWIRMVGSSLVAMRLLSVLTVTVGLQVAYALTRRWWGERGALFAVALLLSHPLLLFYAQEIRPYGLLFTLFVLSLANAELALSRPSWPAWLSLGSVAAAIFLTNYGGAVCLISVAGYTWARSRTRLPRSQFLKYGSVAALWCLFCFSLIWGQEFLWQCRHHVAPLPAALWNDHHLLLCFSSWLELTAGPRNPYMWDESGGSWLLFLDQFRPLLSLLWLPLWLAQGLRPENRNWLAFGVAPISVLALSGLLGHNLLIPGRTDIVWLGPLTLVTALFLSRWANFWGLVGLALIVASNGVGLAKVYADDRASDRRLADAVKQILGPHDCLILGGQSIYSTGYYLQEPRALAYPSHINWLTFTRPEPEKDLSALAHHFSLAHDSRCVLVGTWEQQEELKQLLLRHFKEVQALPESYHLSLVVSLTIPEYRIWIYGTR